MIKINEKNYENPIIEVSFGNYSVTQKGKKRQGESPFISFDCSDVYLGLETTYDKTWLMNLKLKEMKDISSFISDIVYEDEKEWVSLTTGTYKCFVTKTDNNLFIFEFDCNAEECGKIFEISLVEKIKIDLDI